MIIDNKKQYYINKFSTNKFKFICDKLEFNYIKTLNPNKVNSKNYFEIISFNNDDIILKGKKYNIKFFKQKLYKQNIKYIISNSFKKFFFEEDNFYCIKEIFPFLKISENQFTNLDILEEYNLLKKIFCDTTKLLNFKQKKFNSIQHQYKTYLSFKQNRKVHYKSSLDNNFFFSIKSGFSDVFKLLENRPNRTIYQLDVNSMYPFAMIKNNFSIPRNLKYHKSNDLNDILNGNITNGIFNCQMTIKEELTNKQKDFIKYLPINLIENNVSIPLHIKFGDTVNILLHCNEIKYYSKFFDITLEDGIYSKKSMDHPLKNWVLETYQKRLNAEGPLKDFYKFILTVSHSIIMGKSKRYNVVENYQDFLTKEYQFETNDIQNNSYFEINEDYNLFHIKSYKINNRYNVYSLYSQVLANARIHLLELYEKFHSESSSFELCYCNIDSLHISIPNQLNDQFDTILEQVSSKTELGKLKIESISNRGIWFEPGRYWLFKDEELVSFKNTIFNDENEDYKCIYKNIYKKDKKVVFRLFDCLQLKKKIEIINDNHCVYKKTHSIYNILENKIHNKKIYKYIFYKYIN